MTKGVPRKIWNSRASSRDPEVQTQRKRPVDAPNQKPFGSLLWHNGDHRDEAYNLTIRLSSHVNGFLLPMKRGKRRESLGLLQFYSLPSSRREPERHPIKRWTPVWQVKGPQ